MSTYPHAPCAVSTWLCMCSNLILQHSASVSLQGTMSHVQMQIQQDWQNREFIEVIAESIRKITEFLNSFDLSARSRLSQLNEKLTALERQVDYIEARMGKI